MDEGREGGRNEGNRWSNSTALRHKRESCVWAHPQRSEQVERAQDTERESVQEEESERRRAKGSLSPHLKITLSHTSFTPSAGRSSEVEAEFIRSCQRLLSGLFLFFFLNPLLPGFPCAGGQVDFSLQEKTHSGKTEIEKPTRREGKWENCSKSQCLRRKRSSEKLQKVRILIYSSLFQIV